MFFSPGVSVTDKGSKAKMEVLCVRNRIFLRDLTLISITIVTIHISLSNLISIRFSLPGSILHLMLLLFVLPISLL